MSSRLGGLEGVRAPYKGFGPPPVDYDLRTRGSRLGNFVAALDIPLGKLGEVYDEDVRRADLNHLREQILETGRAIREGSTPHTVLHALLLEDEQTLGRIAAKLHRDPRDLELSLGVLVRLGWVAVEGSGPLSRYTLPGIAPSK